MEKTRPWKSNSNSAAAAAVKNAFEQPPYKAALAPTMKKATSARAAVAATTAQMAALTIEPEFEQEWPDTVFLVRSRLD